MAWNLPPCRITGVLALASTRMSAGLRAGLDHDETRRRQMLWTITVLLFLMWLIGMVTNYTLGGFIHLLLLLAIVSVLIRVIQGRRPV
jgi:cell division protein FtsW (lipid II flippase)